MTAPSSPVDLDLAGAGDAARALTQSTLFFLNRNSMPLVSASTDLVLLLHHLRRGRASASTSMPSSANSLPAASNSSEACSSALDGMQPTFRQVPPSVAALLDAGDLQAELGGADRGDVAAGAAADDDDVEGVVAMADLPQSRCGDKLAPSATSSRLRLDVQQQALRDPRWLP